MVKKRLIFLSCMIGMSLIATSCSSDESNAETTAAGETGTIQLSLNTNASFGTSNTRAVTESDYANVSNYAIQILDSNDGVVKTYTASSEISTPVELSNGSYTLKAYYGTESDASRDAFYVEGTTDFIVQADNQTISVTCTPTCGKVITEFDEEMPDFFSNYYVVYTTAALTTAGTTATWSSTDTEPWYLKVDEAGETVTATIYATRISDGKTANVEKDYILKPNQSWTLHIAPTSDNGSLGIAITVNEETTDKEIDIVVPADWV